MTARPAGEICPPVRHKKGGKRKACPVGAHGVRLPLRPAAGDEKSGGKEDAGRCQPGGRGRQADVGIGPYES